MKRKSGKTNGKHKPRSKKQSRLRKLQKHTNKRQRVRQKRSVAPSNRIKDPRVARALRLIRENGLSASVAARRVGMKLETLRRAAGRVLYRSGPGKPWKARSNDQLRFLVRIMTDFGPELVVAPNLRERKLAGAHSFAINMWRAGADGAEAKLKEFEGKTVAGHRLITDTELLTQLEEAGLLDYESFYGSLGGGS